MIMTVSEIINYRVIEWLEWFAEKNPHFTGIEKCPVTGEEFCFVDGIYVEDCVYDRHVEAQISAAE